MESHRSVRQRIIELAVGLAVVLAAIVVTRIWVELKNARRADNDVLRQCVAHTLAAAEQYHLGGGDAGAPAEVWQRFLRSAPGQPVPVDAAHDFVDSFLIRYADGALDSIEATDLYNQLIEIHLQTK